MNSINYSVNDTASRREALNIEKNFVIQAPAGSGKTELLVQRVLKLLAYVGSPEDVLAVTFTRKAAAEMRSRIVDALYAGRSNTPPTEAHARLTWNLARHVLKRDSERSWGLLDNPSRLRIMTIDSLFSLVVGQMPFCTGFGVKPTVSEHPDRLYTEAIDETVSAVFEESHPLSVSVSVVLSHLDNNVPRLKDMLSSMLAKRDQWLRMLSGGGLDREFLDSCLDDIRLGIAEKIQSSLTGFVKTDFFEMLEFIKENLNNAGSSSQLVNVPDDKSFSGWSISDFSALSDLFFTSDGSFRKTLTKAQGFPAGTAFKGADAKAYAKSMKECGLAYIAVMKTHADIVALLSQAKSMPSDSYSDDQWVVLKCLFELLRQCEFNLQNVFSEKREVDFIEISARAGLALGSADSPTDLALSLDYDFQHILVDEFQDTSLSQFEFLEKMVHGWENGDGRTLTLVGDPMQSIYSFRNADVGLYLKAIQTGVGSLKLDFLQLSSNFRSAPKVVDWVNSVFSAVLPSQSDVSLGAVTYSRSNAAREDLAGSGAFMHPFLERDDAAEAQAVISIAKDALANSDNKSIAVLVRNRSHLESIVSTFKAEGIDYTAVEIESLGRRQIIVDLFSLTRALLDPSDNISWYSVFRSPWCGLTLEDLLVLKRRPKSRSLLLNTIKNKEVMANMSDDGKERLRKVVRIMCSSIQDRCRYGLRRWIESCWMSLGGSALLESQSDLEDVSRYFELLDKYDRGGNLAAMDEFTEKVTRLYAAPNSRSDGRLQLMTIHKAKGLEFDVVILPGLGRSARTPDQQLLLWDVKSNDYRNDSVVLAPVRKTGGDTDPIYQYISSIESKRTSYEDARLFYVAATRAKNALHLLGAISCDEKTDLVPKPSKGSMLSHIWDYVEDVFQSHFDKVGFVSSTSSASNHVSGRLIRIQSGWEMNSPAPAIDMKQSADTRFSRSFT
ncbi:MAG TPA: DNA helicase UvrD [Porticoccus sp.]|nr:DNA helicase UvrD [Porticoccus sp.]